MNSSKTILYIILGLVTIIGALSCSHPKTDVEENEALLEHFFKSLNDEDYPVYHKTLPKEKIERYLGEGFSVENVYFLGDSPDSLEYYFDDSAINKLVKNVNYYTTLNITQEQTNGHMVVQEEDIPEFVKDRSMPPSFNYSGFYNVYFLSTPIISQNRGIFFIDTYGASGIGITIRFYMRKNKDAPWIMVGSGAVHELEYYRKD